MENRSHAAAGLYNPRLAQVAHLQGVEVVHAVVGLGHVRPIAPVPCPHTQIFASQPLASLRTQGGNGDAQYMYTWAGSWLQVAPRKQPVMYVCVCAYVCMFNISETYVYEHTHR